MNPPIEKDPNVINANIIVSVEFVFSNHLNIFMP